MNASALNKHKTLKRQRHLLVAQIWVVKPKLSNFMYLQLTLHFTSEHFLLENRWNKFMRLQSAIRGTWKS